ncbi:unnamed protein product [Rotaria sp. Silwood2]|nr:unnamed protein product [Rotaria sp. Silwood2]CAF3063930.1 unnamed protein product [Rotaria sp. Silwood2]CAF4150367.1 unnamed protein product [Rotaria sp. Silwood2]CAF4274760.1 unnamed protein product [Rotaria sp. Silwood2]
MSNVEAKLLAKSVGQLVCMKSFSSTSIDLGIAEMYANIEAQSNTEEVAFVIFIIDAIPSENNRRLRPSVDIAESSQFGTKENEILFMLGSVFCIENVEQDVNRRWIFGDGQNVNETDDDTFHSFGVLLLGEEHRLIAEIYIDLGRMYYEKKQLDKALDYYTRGLTVAQKLLPDTRLGFTNNDTIIQNIG